MPFPTLFSRFKDIVLVVSVVHFVHGAVLILDPGVTPEYTYLRGVVTLMHGEVGGGLLLVVSACLALVAYRLGVNQRYAGMCLAAPQLLAVSLSLFMTVAAVVQGATSNGSTPRGSVLVIVIPHVALGLAYYVAYVRTFVIVPAKVMVRRKRAAA